MMRFPANHDRTDAGSFKTDPSDSLPHADAPHHLCAYGVIRGAEKENERVLMNSWMLLLSVRAQEVNAIQATGHKSYPTCLESFLLFYGILKNSRESNHAPSG